jgi:hypothetical protein
MNHVRPLGDILSFAPLNYEHMLFLPAADRETIVDVKLSLHGHPTLLSHGGLLGTGCEQVHVYLNEIDFTDLIIEDLRRKLDAYDQDLLLRLYQRALDSWLRLEEALGAAYGQPDIESERRAAASLLAVRPISANLDHLGYHTAGWSGNLHIFNFLYNLIPLPSISLNELIALHNSQPGAVQIERGTVNSATFSCGPCRLFSNAWRPDSPLPRGSLSVLIESHHHDPLEDRVTELERKVVLLQKLVQDEFEWLRDVLGTAGDIQKRLSQIKKLTDDVSREARDCKMELGSHSQQVATLQASVRELKDLVDNL